MFRSKGIVLNIQKIRDNQIRIVLFTREYGKITCWSKKQISADIGCIISIFIERKGNQNLLKTHETLASAGDMFQKYDEVICFLQLLDSLNLMLPEGSENHTIYDDLTEIIHTLEIQKYTEKFMDIGKVQLFILMHIRFMKCLGFLKKSHFEKKNILTYIHNHIDIKKIDDIIQSKNMESTVLSELENIILQTRHYFLHST